MKKITTEHGIIYHGDVLKVMKKLPDDSVDMVFGSPYYDKMQRTYGIESKIKTGDDWTAWMVEVFQESLRVCTGLVAYVVGHGSNGVTNWSAAPALLMADLHRAGVCLRNPAIYRRDGIPGSGGDDWLKANYEWIICATRGGKLPWSNNTACGHKPKFPIGGALSHRTKKGPRIGRAPRGYKDGDLSHQNHYVDVDVVNPGLIVDCGAAGGGHLGSNIAHEGEAPFPEKLVRFFAKSFCKPGGVILDPFGGSGTTAAVAIATGRRFITCDIRESQIKLIRRRIRQSDLRKGFLQDM